MPFKEGDCFYENLHDHVDVYPIKLHENAVLFYFVKCVVQKALFKKKCLNIHNLVF